MTTFKKEHELLLSSKLYSHYSDFPSYLINGGDSIISSSWFLSSNQNPNKVHSFWSIDRSLKLLSIYIPSPSSFLSLPICYWRCCLIYPVVDRLCLLRP